MPKCAQHVVYRPHSKSITVDGEEFPWFVSDAGVAASLNPESLVEVSITILAEMATLDFGTVSDV